MKFMFFSEGETLPGESYQIRYWELVDQVIHAEKWGFDSFGVSEQQFAIGGVSTSCPEVLYGYLFPLTQRLRFAHAITLLPKNINHALKVACRTAVQDVLSMAASSLVSGAATPRSHCAPTKSTSRRTAASGSKASRCSRRRSRRTHSCSTASTTRSRRAR